MELPDISFGDLLRFEHITSLFSCLCMSMLTSNSSGKKQKHGYLGCFHAASTRENISGVCVIPCREWVMHKGLSWDYFFMFEWSYWSWLTDRVSPPMSTAPYTIPAHVASHRPTVRCACAEMSGYMRAAAAASVAQRRKLRMAAGTDCNRRKRSGVISKTFTSF